MSYPRFKNHTGLLYAPMVATDLRGGWYAGPEVLEELGVSDRDATTETVTVRDLFGSQVASHRFMRLFVAVDSDDDGLPDDWEMLLFGNLDHAGADDYDLDGLTNLFEWQHGGGPHAADFYNGRLPTLAIVSGNAQQAGPDVFLPQPLTVEVRDSASALLTNAPIHFEVIAGAGRIAAMTGDTPITALDLRTDAQGRVSAWFKTPFTAETSTVRASAHSGAQIAAVTFIETTVTLPAAPKYFTVAIDDDQNHELKWVPGSADETGFTIWQSLDDGATWQPVAQAPVAAESATVPSAPGVSPLWAATADNDAGSSPKSYEPSFALRDDDSDGFDNQTEGDLGTDRLNPDHDGDGTPDGSDISPLDPDLNQPRIPESRYAVLDLTEQGWLSDDHLHSINNAGQMIGYSFADGYFFWDQGERTALPLDSVAGLNDQGVVAGVALDTEQENSSFVAARWTAATAVEKLYGFEPASPDAQWATLSRPVGTSVGGINNAGTIVGVSSGSFDWSEEMPDPPYSHITFFSRYTRWPASSPEAPGAQGDSLTSFAGGASAINDDGTFVGWIASNTTSAITDAMVFDGSYTHLPKTDPTFESLATTLNNQGLVAGYQNGVALSYKATLWAKPQGTGGSPAWKAKYLGSYDSAIHQNALVPGYVREINDRLEMIGHYEPTPTQKGGLLWQNGQVSNLEGRLPEGWTLLAANGINDAGVIAGRAQKATAGVATPVPAPVTPLDLQVRARMGATNPTPLDWGPSKTPKSLIVDANNGLVNGQRRNAETSLPATERNNGSYNDLQRVEPLFVFIPGGQSMKNYKLVLRLTGAPAGVRIFDSDTTPRAVLGATAAGNQTQYELTVEQKERGNQTFWIEGIEAGEFTVALEWWDANYFNAQPYNHPPAQVRFEVNVDREPIAAGDVAKFSSRHRVRAVKTATQLRGMKGNISGKRPLATWTPQRLRSGLTESLWFGLDSTTWQGFPLPTWIAPGTQRPAGPKAWVQMGLEVKCDRAVDFNSKSESFAYAEVVADFDLYNWALANKKSTVRYLRRRTYPPSTTVRHRWHDAAFSAEYQPNLSNSLQDRVTIQLTTIPGGSAVMLLDFPGDHGTNGDHDVDLSLIDFDSYQAGAEMTSSVSRLPGTENQPASIDYMSVKTGPRTSISSWQQTDFQDNNLEICLVNASGMEERFTGNDPSAGTGTVAKLHYNIRLGTAYSLSLWDKYNWLEQDPAKWITP